MSGLCQRAILVEQEATSSSHQTQVTLGWALQVAKERLSSLFQGTVPYGKASAIPLLVQNNHVVTTQKLLISMFCLDSYLVCSGRTLESFQIGPTC